MRTTLDVLLFSLVIGCGGSGGGASPGPATPAGTTQPTAPASTATSSGLDAAACAQLFDRYCALVFEIDPVPGEVVETFMPKCRAELRDKIAACPTDRCAPPLSSCLDQGEKSYKCLDAYTECSGSGG